MQMLAPLEQKVLCTWEWPELSEWKAKKQSEDPEDMELFMVTVNTEVQPGADGSAGGAFAFEFDDAFSIAEAFSAVHDVRMQEAAKIEQEQEQQEEERREKEEREREAQKPPTPEPEPPKPPTPEPEPEKMGWAEGGSTFRL